MENELPLKLLDVNPLQNHNLLWYGLNLSTNSNQYFYVYNFDVGGRDIKIIVMGWLWKEFKNRLCNWITG